MKKCSGDISKLHIHTEFKENRPIHFVSSDAHRLTHILTDIFYNHFFGLGDFKRVIPPKSQHEIFFTTVFSPYTVYMGESRKSPFNNKTI